MVIMTTALIMQMVMTKMNTIITISMMPARLCTIQTTKLLQHPPDLR